MTVTSLISLSSKYRVLKPSVLSTYPISFSPESFAFSFKRSTNALPFSNLSNLTAATAL
uniref:Uncharacterized protein n=1 Tax=Arundo donax TaxID=35708 RepID=A0A0A8YR66_ARUDO